MSLLESASREGSGRARTRERATEPARVCQSVPRSRATSACRRDTAAGELDVGSERRYGMLGMLRSSTPPTSCASASDVVAPRVRGDAEVARPRRRVPRTAPASAATSTGGRDAEPAATAASVAASASRTASGRAGRSTRRRHDEHGRSSALERRLAAALP